MPVSQYSRRGGLDREELTRGYDDSGAGSGGDDCRAREGILKSQRTIEFAQSAFDKAAPSRADRRQSARRGSAHRLIRRYRAKYREARERTCRNPACMGNSQTRWRRQVPAMPNFKEPPKTCHEQN